MSDRETYRTLVGSQKALVGADPPVALGSAHCAERRNGSRKAAMGDAHLRGGERHLHAVEQARHAYPGNG